METQLFGKLEKEIKELSKQEINLETLAKHVSTEAFDDEDRTIVHNKQMHIASTKSRLEEILVHKKEIYHTQVKSMEARLQQRQVHLEEFGKKYSVFKDFPDVLEFFARKQSRLNETLNSVKNKLAQ